MPEQARRIRRAEIASDLWESQRDSNRGDLRTAANLMARLAIGIPDDLGWRLEQAPLAGRRFEKAAALAAAVCLTALWLFTSLRMTELPRPQTPAPLIDVAVVPSPPPPPPPPPPWGR
jgi:hypothetical protein